ncbi:TPA: hypothetical protein EYP37_02910 [Candidatus Poribacteria bacterium]|nr:hypothetical protein [Candidatus Poribacteria bacterium]
MKKRSILGILFLISLISITGCATKYHYVNYPYRHRLIIEYPYPRTVYYYEPAWWCWDYWPPDIIILERWYYWDCDDPPSEREHSTSAPLRSNSNPHRRENLRERLRARRLR